MEYFEGSRLVAYSAVIIILFMFGRELVLWYFKINKRTELLEEIRDLLEEANKGNKQTEDSSKEIK
ncbi:MAG: hypothetical protein M3Q63_03760 [bacterium]|nr:hypothetical protein [bacterium]